MEAHRKINDANKYYEERKDDFRNRFNKLGLSKEEFAKLIGSSTVYVSNLLYYDNPISDKMFERLKFVEGLNDGN